MAEVPAPERPAFAAEREKAPCFAFAGGLWIVLGDAHATGGHLAGLEAIYGRGPLLPRRRHEREDVFYYVLEGELAVRLDAGEERVAMGGSFIFVPRGTMHDTRVVSDAARVYQCLLPAGYEQLILTRGVRTALDGDAPRPRTQVSGADWEAFGVTVQA